MRRLFLLLVVCGALAAAGYTLYAFDWPFGPRTETFVDIAPGTPSRAIAAQLQKQGIIANLYSFEALRLARGGTLKAGMYRFDRPRKLSEVYAQIERGDVYTLTLTIPEGANLFDIASRVETAGLGSAATFLAAARKHVELVRLFDPSATTLEGYLYPDTYHFAPGSTPEQILTAMVRRFGVQVAALGMEGDLHKRVTLASLIERETPIDAERPMVASVFLNRLDRGMPLETDPTVIYAALLAGRYRGSIYQSDLAADSPYNTYRHAGLPPGPICNAGAASLRAAQSPAHTDFLYFVAAGSDPHGQSRFAVTLEEHQRNVAAYRQSMRGAEGR